MNNPFVCLKKIPFSLMLIACLVFISILSYLYFLVPVNPDSAVFDYIGWVITEGGVAYVDAADQNWPGQMFIHALSTWLFGNEIWSYRAFEITIIVPLSCLILFAFVDKAVDRLPALLVIPCFYLIYMTAGYWVSGQRDIVAGPLLIAAAFFLYQRQNGGFVWNLVCQGVFIGLATIIRPTLLVFAPLLFIADLLLIARSGRSYWKVIIDHSLSTVMVLAVIGGVALLGLSNGGFSGWYEISVLFALEVYSQTVPIWEAIVGLSHYYLTYWHVFLLLSVVGGVLFWRKNLTAFVLVFMLFPAAVVSVLVQGKGLGYHLAVMLPLVAILVAIALAYAFGQLLKQQLTPAVLGFAVLLPLLVIIGSAVQIRYTYSSQVLMLAGKIDRYGMYQRYVATAGDLVNVKDIMLLAEYVEQSTSVEDTVLFWGRPVHVNTLSKRKSPLFAASFALLASTTSEFSAFEKWRSNIQSAMFNKPPQLLMLVRSDEPGQYMWISGTDREDKLSGVILDHLNRYRYEKSFGRVDVLRLKQ